MRSGKEPASKIGSQMDRRFQCYFSHDNLLRQIVGTDRWDNFYHIASSRYPQMPHLARSVVADDLLGQLADPASGVPQLATLYSKYEMAPAKIFIHTQSFYFKRDNHGSRHMHGKLSFAPLIAVQGRISESRFLNNTAAVDLSRRTEVTLLAMIEDSVEESLIVKPILIGVDTPSDGGIFLTYPPSEFARVHLEDFDAFRDVDMDISHADIEKVKELSENQIKSHFAEILNEPFVPKDWGGEKSDLYTSHLKLGGKSVSAAFAFKGPGLKTETLHVSNMGKRGNQGLRLAEEPAEILVVQFHSRISSDVIQLMQAICVERGRRFLILDGTDTARILKHHGKI